VSSYDYFANIYAAQRNGIHAHAHHVDGTNLHMLDGMDFVFLSIDKPAAKNCVIAHLERAGIPFIDCGMGIVQTDNGLTGQVRTTVSTPANRDQARAHIPMAAGADGDNAYDSNIQIADLNAFNALQAVIKWKKLNGFYADLGNERNTSTCLPPTRFRTKINQNEDGPPCPSVRGILPG
jgi:hypothetical protein